MNIMNVWKKQLYLNDIVLERKDTKIHKSFQTNIVIFFADSKPEYDSAK